MLQVGSCLCACLFVLSPTLLFMYPKIISGSRVTYVALNQYGAVASLLAFFGTYTLDLLGTRRSHQPQDEDQRQVT